MQNEDEWETFARNKYTGEVLPLGTPPWKNEPTAEEIAEDDEMQDDGIPRLPGAGAYGQGNPSMTTEVINTLLQPGKIGNHATRANLRQNAEIELQKVFFALIGEQGKFLALGNTATRRDLEMLQYRVDHIVESAKRNPYLRGKLSNEAAEQIALVARCQSSRSNTFSGDGMNTERQLTGGVLKTTRVISNGGEATDGLTRGGGGLFNQLKQLAFGTGKSY